jgi:hypothetical protein
MAPHIKLQVHPFSCPRDSARGQTDMAAVAIPSLQFLITKAKKYKKFWEDLIAFPFIQHGPHGKRKN